MGRSSRVDKRDFNKKDRHNCVDVSCGFGRLSRVHKELDVDAAAEDAGGFGSYAVLTLHFTVCTEGFSLRRRFRAPEAMD